MPPPSFDGVLAQTPPSYGPQLTVWSPWAPSYRVALGTSGFSSMMTPQPGTSAASSIEILSPFHLPGPGLLGSSLSEAPEPIQAYMSPYAPVLATSLGPMTSRYSCGQSHFPGRQPPPLLKTKSRKNSGAKNKSTKGEKGGSSDAGREHVAAARKPWLTVPSRHEVQDGIPKGLEVLAMVDSLTVSQEAEALEALVNAFGIGYEGSNSYEIKSGGTHIYRAVEDTNFLWRCLCNQLRPVHLRIFDLSGNQPCRENVTVFLGSKDDGNVIGRVTQSCCGGCFKPKLNILDKESKRQLVMKGPCIVTDCCGAKFDVHSETGDKIKVAEVKKRGPRNLSDVMKEIVTDADEFQIVFLKSDLKVETKATVLVALFIVDLLFFEYGGNANRNLDESCTVDLCVIFCCGWPLPCRVTLNGLGQSGDRRLEGAPEAAEMER